jgi:hypothetical protein
MSSVVCGKRKLEENDEDKTETETKKEETKKEENDWMCLICLAEKEPAPEAGGVVALLCKHSFCGDCIQIWLAQSNQCPICKAPQQGNNTKFRFDPPGDVVDDYDQFAITDEEEAALDFFVSTNEPGVENSALQGLRGVKLSVEEFEQFVENMCDYQNKMIAARRKKTTSGRTGRKAKKNTVGFAKQSRDGSDNIYCPFPHCPATVPVSKWQEHVDKAHCVEYCDRCNIAIEHHLLARHKKTVKCSERARRLANVSNLEEDWYSRQSQ